MTAQRIMPVHGGGAVGSGYHRGMEPELVSVLTRTRDRPELLAEAVASVAGQDYAPLEMVVVNDGGRDVGSVLEPFRERLSIRYVDAPAGGRCRAGNRAMGEAGGAWFAWLDDDDVYYPDHVSTLVTALQESGHRVGYSDAHRIDLERAPSGAGWREVRRSVPYSQDFDRLEFFRRPYIHPVTVLHHRECFDRLGGFDEELEVLEDWDLLFRFAREYDFRHVTRVTAAFRIRDDHSNAVVSLTDAFARTRPRLVARYAHAILPELLRELEHGRSALSRLIERIDGVASAMDALGGVGTSVVDD